MIDAKPFAGSRVLAAWNERRQLERALAERGRVAMKQVGFAGASISRLTASMGTWSGAINADLDMALAILRARARSLCANNEWGKRFLSLVATNIVGARGPTLQVRAKMTNGALDKVANDAIEGHWLTWCRRCDIARRMSLPLMLRVAMKAVARDGEAVIRKVRGRKHPYGLALQMLEADRLDETFNARLDNGNIVRQGVEIDSSTRPIAFYLWSTHPGENGMIRRVRDRVLAEDIIHLYLPERAEQVRGYSWFHAVLLRGSMMHGLEEAAVVAARVGASKMGVWTQKEDASDVGLNQLADGKDASTGNLLMSAEPGDFIEAPKGYSLESWDPAYPHENFESFLKALLRGLASGLDVAAHNLSGDMTDVNYSSARIAELSEREVWMTLQDWLIEGFVYPLFAEEWLPSALLRGAITLESGAALPAARLDKFASAARLLGRRWAWVDPLKEANAAEKLIELGVESRHSVAAGYGRDFDENLDELADETARMKQAGLATAPKAAAAPAKPAPPDEPEEEPAK